MSITISFRVGVPRDADPRLHTHGSLALILPASLLAGIRW